ncbi:MAG: transketolase C-terminal domain-containing protein [Verrucomicrobiota bacterium]
MRRPGQTVAMSVVESVSDYATIAAPFGKALVEVGSRRPEVLGLTADLGKYTDILPFAEAFPDRFFNVGMAEQNLIGVAAGLARTGFVPFCTTYCVFATRRAYDFIAIDCAVSRTNVKIMAGLPGLTTGYGATHQGIEDLALMRSIPGLMVIDPCDATELSQVVYAISDYDGPVYVRLLRGQVPVVLDPQSYRFQLNRAQLLRRGTDVGIISTGLMSQKALEAAKMLAAEGIGAALLHVPTLKPLDAAAIAELAASVPLLVSVENHVVTGGLGSAVADVIVSAQSRTQLVKIGIPDRFIECGSLPFLHAKYGLTTANIVATVRSVLNPTVQAAERP